MGAIFFRTVIIYFLLGFIIKMMEKRQIGELEVSELVSTLILSEVAAIPIADPDLPLLNAIIPVLFILAAEMLVSFVKNKSAKLKSAVEGEAVYLVFRGKVKQKALGDNRISLNELLSEVRTQGYGGLSDIYYAILEPNGKLSLLPTPDAAPLCHKNKETADGAVMAHAAVIDGEVRERCLSRLGYNRAWLDGVLRRENVKAEEVFLLTVDDAGKTELIKKETK